MSKGVTSIRPSAISQLLTKAGFQRAKHTSHAYGPRKYSEGFMVSGVRAGLPLEHLFSGALVMHVEPDDGPSRALADVLAAYQYALTSAGYEVRQVPSMKSLIVSIPGRKWHPLAQ